MFVFFRHKPDSEMLRAVSRRRDASYYVALVAAIGGAAFVLWIIYSLTRAKAS
jgi:hypothetical protein